MYTYNTVDQQIVDERVNEFRDQTQRYLKGQLSEEEFRPLRLQNGLYIQRHAPMLRVAIPYGLLAARQLRQLASIVDQFDKGFGHFTTRQNIQFNWVQLEQVPDILASLASVQMHAIQTSGNCIRNITIDPLSDVATDSSVDVRPYAELLRQWSTNHPEFLYLPRKFKIAINGAATDRAAIKAHDIGLQARRVNDQVVFDIYCGGGLGRTPIIGKVVYQAVPEAEVLNYLEAIMRVYNMEGRRDNKYKARIKILVKALGVDNFRSKVELARASIPFKYAVLKRLSMIKAQIIDPNFKMLNHHVASGDRDFTTWLEKNTQAHQQPGYQVVHITLKQFSAVPGDVSANGMRAIADLAEQYSFGQIRTTHRQNLILPHVEQAQLLELYHKLLAMGLIRANLDTASDMICCPGFDFCSLANAEAISVAKAIDTTLVEAKLDKTELSINISGCMNACGHHHIAGVGLLGVDKDGEDWYQITLGGSAKHDARIGKIIGRSIIKAEVPKALKKIVATYRDIKNDHESMPELIERVGVKPFKEAVYG